MGVRSKPKFGFPVAAVIAYRTNFEKSYLPQFLRSEERRVGKEIIPSCNIHTVEEETLDGGLKGGGKEELGKGE